MILPLVQDLLVMSGQALRTRYPQDYRYIKTIALEKWKHIQIQEKQLSENINAQRHFVGTKKVFWLIIVNSRKIDAEKYKALIHELMHCFIDEIKLIDKSEEEELLERIEKNI